MGSESDIATQIRTALAQHLKRDVSRIRPEDRLREDLGLDSLAMIELLFKIEEHFDLEIPNEDLSRITTVADVTAYVEEKLGRRPAPAPAAVAAPVAAAAAGSAPVPAAPRPVGSAAATPTPLKRPAAKAAAPAAKRGPAKVTPIKAAASRRAGKGASKPAAAKKKGSRRA
jgi:acyl carrier protein